MTVQVAGGYHAIALPLAHSVFGRYIYVKQHLEVDKSKKSSGTSFSSTLPSLLDPERTVFVCNLPSQSDDQWLRETLEKAIGSIQQIVGPHASEEKCKASGSKTAHVVFKAKSSVDKLLQVDHLEHAVVPSNKPHGLQGLKTKYFSDRPGLQSLKEEADSYMAAFDAKEQADRQRRQEMRNQVDADGFQTVVNKRKKPSLNEDEDISSVMNASQLEQLKKKKKTKDLHNFYRFQLREVKRDQLKTLRDRFEEDRHLIEKMKQAKQYKPE